MGRNCEVCKEVQFKYKCPACLTPYCSVACFKKHKENLCQKVQPPIEEATATNESTQPTQPLENESFKSSENLCQKLQPPVEKATATNESTQPTQPLENESFKSNVEVKIHSGKTIEVEEENSIVSKERLYSLVECKEIRDALKSNELQNLILRIDSSEEPEQELDKAMGSQYFHEFTEKILDVISKRDG
ncbi:HIT-type Zinc finger family protein isoform X1 [Carex rostrata]